MSFATCRKADAFIASYYKTRDKARLGQYYNANTKVVWNGNPMTGDQFMELSLPEFRISSFDVQDSGSNILISVSGSANTKDQKHLFSQVILAVVDATTGKLMIMADIFRFV